MGPDPAQSQLVEPLAMPGPNGKRTAAWRPVAASVRGRGHEQRSQPCQDACGVILTGDGVLIAAVADGAGSAARAEEGSALAVEVALEALQRAVAAGPL